MKGPILMPTRFLTGLMALALVIAGCSTVQPQTPASPPATQPADSPPAASAPLPSKLDFMSAAQGGAWYPIAVAMSNQLQKDIPEIKDVTLKPGGGVSNVVGVNEGQGQMGFSTGISVADGYAGKPPFKGKTDKIRMAATFFPHMAQLVVPAESPIQSVADLKGKRISVGQKGLTSQVVANLVMAAYGLTAEDVQQEYLGFTESVEALKDGHLDAVFMANPIPFAPFVDFSTTREARFVSIDPDKIAAIAKANPGLLPAVIKKGTYRGQDADVTTLQTPFSLIVQADLSEDFVYRVMKSVMENLSVLGDVNASFKGLTPEDLTGETGLPYHPGALKYFQEKGWKQ